jgi:release factor glutamine methyltransferase
MSTTSLDHLSAGSAIAHAAESLSSAGIDDSRAEAMSLLMFATDCRREKLIRDPNRLLSGREEIIFRKAVTLRAERRPLAYITGERWFYGRPFRVNRAVLIPRPETELLVEFAVEKAKNFDLPVCFADIGTGSGCIAVSVAAELPNSSVSAVDLSPLALLVAKKNVVRHKVDDRVLLRQGDLLAPLAGHNFDIILSNPPYIPAEEVPGLMPEVRLYEPHMALSPGAEVDGTEIHKRLLEGSFSLLNPGGWIALEVGEGQADTVYLFAQQYGYKQIEVRRDYGGIKRVVAAQRL